MLAFSEQKKNHSRSPENFYLQKKELNNHSFNPFLQPIVQPTLTIGAPDDAYEKEADTMAEKVMRMPMPEPISFSSGKNIVSRKCSECEEEEKLHRKESNSDSTSVAPPIVHEVLNSSGGKSLDADTRSFMEPRFNYDFSNVKIHDNHLAAKSADSINALAYTSGNNVVFNSGQYNTNSDSGKRLLAHELTHVVQNHRITNSIIKAKEFKSTGRANRETPDIINHFVIKSKLLTKYVGADRIKTALLNSGNFHVLSSEDLEEYKSKCEVGKIKDVGGFFCRHAKDKNLKDDIFVVRYLKLGYVLHEFIHKLSGITVINMLGTFVNEGITQFFADLILKEGHHEILTDHGYKEHLECANNIVTQTSTETVANAYFNNNTKLISDLQKLLHLKNPVDVSKYFKKPQCLP